MNKKILKKSNKKKNKNNSILNIYNKYKRENVINIIYKRG